MRLLIYSLTSISLFTITTLSAFSSRPNFYSAAIHLGRSSASLMVLANFGVWLGILVGLGVKKIFFGRLRGVEYEHLFERLWLFLTESLLALTIFRDDFSVGFAVMYGVLVFLKCFHWITADRVDYMDQIPPPGPPINFHIRIGTIITLLATIDLLLVLYSLDSILTYGVSAKVLFVSEFMVLLASIHGTMARYVVNCLDLRRARGREDAPAWEQKSMYMFYIDLGVDFAKLLTYFTFFTVILLNYGIPLHILRDVWMTFRSFISRCSDLIRYRRATRDMDAQYPDATEEDVGRLGDRVCIICREEMVVAGQAPSGLSSGDSQETTEPTPTPAPVPPPAQEGGPNETPKKLVCGHVFHFHCLRSWLERQQSCPTCRRDVLHTPAPTRQRRPAPPAPPPAPAAVPVPPNREELRDQWNEFFRLPEQNGALPPAPVPAAGVAPTPAHVPTATAAPVNPVTASVPLTNDEDARIQTSIWGGPIQPGRFFAPPLGSIRPTQIPRPILRPTPTQAQAGPSRPVPIQTSQPTQESDQHPPPSVLPTGFSTFGHGLDAASPSMPGSEATTPFSSNPPEIFRSMSSESETENDEKEVERSEGGRRLAAEAAMRRLGLMSGKSTNGLSGAGAGTGKGKQKETELVKAAESIEPISIQEQNKKPYLGPITRSAPHPYIPRTREWDVEDGNGDHSTPTTKKMRQGVDERLMTLKRVDDTIWGLVEELTRIKSLMDVDDIERSEGVEERGEDQVDL